MVQRDAFSLGQWCIDDWLGGQILILRDGYERPFLDIVAVPFMALLMLYPIFCLFQAYKSPLWHIPGPKVTRFTRLYEFYYNALQPYRYGDRVLEMHQEYGRIVRINPNEVHINDPKFHLGFGQGRLKKKDPWYYTVGLPRATGLISNEQHHQHHRSALREQLAPRLKTEIPDLLRAKTEQLCARLREHAKSGRCVNLSDAFRSMARDLLSVLFVGSCEEMLLSPDLGHQGLLATRGLFRNAAITRQFPGLLYLENFIPTWACRYIFPLLHFKWAIHREVTECVRGSKTGNGSPRLSQSLASGKSSLELADIIDEMVEGLIGGTEAIGHASTNLGYHLLHQPEVVCNLRNRLQEGGFDEYTSPGDLQKRFPLIGAIAKEGLRSELGNMYRFPRVCRESMVYNGYHIPAGTTVSISPRATHQDPDIFSDPGRFQPNRWLGPDSQELENYLMVFGHGTHKCLGSSLALMVIQYLLARVFWEFEFVPLKDQGQDGSLEIFPPRSARGLEAMVHISRT